MGIINQEIKYQIEHKLKSARDLEDAGKILHAVQIYNTLITEYPQQTEAYFRLAELYEILGKIDSAVKLLFELLDKNIDQKEVKLFLAQFLLRNSLWQEANDIIESLVPDEEPIVSFFLGYSHFMLKNFEAAKVNFLNFISFDEQTEMIHEAYLYLAKIEIQMNDFKNALTYAKKAEVIYNNFWDLNLVLGISYYNLGMHAHAILPIEKAIKLNPSESSVREWAGKIFLRSGDFLKAEENFLKFIELKEDPSSEIYSNLGEACLNAKKTEEAVAYFEIAIKLDPNNILAKKGLQKASLVLGNN